MVQVIWSVKALHQVDAIAEFIANDSSFYAKRLVSVLLRKTRRLETFPEMGAIVPEFSDPTLRELYVFSYRIIYRFRQSQNQVRIVGVIHGRRLLFEEMLDLT
ncbi:MAG: type II toxin-antitoxin system RelE/ParE family toxin [Thermoguttaceae bacterium]